FRAYDQETGEILWEVNLGAPVNGYPITYAVDGQQYVAVSTGGSGLAFGLARRAPETRPGRGDQLYLLKLPRGRARPGLRSAARPTARPVDRPKAGPFARPSVRRHESSKDDEEPLITPLDTQRDGFARTHRAQRARQVVDRADRRPIHASDHVAGLEPRPRRTARRIDVRDEHAFDVAVAGIGPVDVAEIHALQAVHSARRCAAARRRLCPGISADRRLDRAA